MQRASVLGSDVFIKSLGPCAAGMQRASVNGPFRPAQASLGQPRPVQCSLGQPNPVQASSGQPMPVQASSGQPKTV